MTTVLAVLVLVILFVTFGMFVRQESRAHDCERCPLEEPGSEGEGCPLLPDRGAPPDAGEAKGVRLPMIGSSPVEGDRRRP